MRPRAQERHPYLMAALLRRTVFWLVHPGRDANLGEQKEQTPAGSGCPHEPAAFPAQPASSHLEDYSHDRQLQGLPRRGGGPLVNLTAHCGHRWPVSGACPKQQVPVEATGGYGRDDETTLAGPDSHSPASRHGASLSKYSGAMRPSSAWNSRTKGRRDTSTRDCRARRAGEMESPPLRSLQGPLRPGSARVCPGQYIPQTPQDTCPQKWPNLDPRLIRRKPKACL